MATTKYTLIDISDKDIDRALNNDVDIVSARLALSPKKTQKLRGHREAVIKYCTKDIRNYCSCKGKPRIIKLEWRDAEDRTFLDVIAIVKKHKDEA